jgi:hypothetical protein
MDTSGGIGEHLKKIELRLVGMLPNLKNMLPLPVLLPLGFNSLKGIALFHDPDVPHPEHY